MDGVAGLVSYLALWGAFLWLVFRKKGFSALAMATLLFGVSYFAHIFVVFDQISTWIPFFAALAFLVFVSEFKDEEKKPAHKTAEAGEANNYTLPLIFGAIAIFFLYSLIFWTVIPFSQMSTYLGAYSSSNLTDFTNAVKSSLTPFTYAQEDIRGHFLSMAMSSYAKNPNFKDLFNLALNEMVDLVNRDPANPRYALQAGEAYNFRGKMTNNADDLKTAEKYFRQALAWAPRRQDVIYDLSMSVLSQGRINEALDLLNGSMKDDSQVPETHYYLAVAQTYSGDYKDALANAEYAASRISMPQMSNLYQQFLAYFYKEKDKADFMTTANRLEILESDKKSELDQILNYVNKGQWPVINFQ